MKQKSIIILFFIAIAFVTLNAADQQAGVDDVAQEVLDSEFQEGASFDILSNDPEENIKREKMLACLNLVKAKYNKDEDQIREILTATTITPEKMVNKIIADMMLTCFNKIQDKESKDLSQFSQNPLEIDHTQYLDLLEFSVEKYAQLDDVQVELTRKQAELQQNIEVLNEQLQRMREEELRIEQSAGPAIFGLPLSEMGTSFKAIYMTAIVATFCLIFYVVINKLMHKEVSFTKQKKLEREKKRTGSKKSGTSSSSSPKKVATPVEGKKVGTPVEGKKSQ